MSRKPNLRIGDQLHGQDAETSMECSGTTYANGCCRIAVPRGDEDERHGWDIESDTPKDAAPLDKILRF